VTVVAHAEEIATPRATPASSLWRNRAFGIGIVIVGAWLATAVAAPLIAPQSPVDVDVMNRLQPPSAAHLFGTDEAGRDNFSRIVYGARITIPAALGVIVIATLVGSAFGAVAGYAGGRVDEILMRVVDVVLAFPSILLAMAITAALGLGLKHAMLAMILVWWPEFARLMRGQVLATKAHDYVTSARALGARTGRILVTHVIPNTLPPILVKSTLDIGNAIILTAALSFIGLGAVPPEPEWGAMIAAGRAKFEYWWAATFPGLAILSVVLGFNFLGDGLQDWLNPRLRND
jgi:peptide/nickel transport system permease protein